MKRPDAFKLIQDSIRHFLMNPEAAEPVIIEFEARFAGDTKEAVTTVLTSSNLSYRDALIIQLAYGVLSDSPLDLTRRQEGARSVAGKVGRFFAKNHISAVKDAYQNIGKNTEVLTRGNFEKFDRLLEWASGMVNHDLKVIFDYSCALVAATARPVMPFPQIDNSKLTFANVSGLFDELLSQGSQGANEQFLVAALLSALLAQVREPSLRVETKSLNASDKSSRTAGDVQVLIGNRVLEAYEVTANLWDEKLPGAEKAIREHDLSRIHIVARAHPGTKDEVIGRLKEFRFDISVIDLASFSSTILSSLTKQDRAFTLQRLYEYLDRYQGDVEKVNRFVNLLGAHGLVIP